MRKPKALSLIFAVIIFSCSKDKIVPSVAETNGVLLAGAKGSSKSWKLASTTLSINGGAAQPGVISSCTGDNVIQFSNNSTQDFQTTDGAVKCSATDPSIIEKGNWALSLDGKTMIIESEIYITQAQVNANPSLLFFLLNQGIPLTITNISDSAFTFTYTVVDDSVTPNNRYLLTINLVKN
ncbi:hypothetical protein WSM22_33760 [Cytophagales bacterium WSM2-2]|nr:hypothetical protein WSM22_33760 [Cytophagales bacterium WSM2-2]